jgi:uncharacterized phage infection (PIP) family protein YhgE
MKSRSNQSSAAQNPAVPAQPNSYAPSVPISIYRELAAELDATRALLETVHTENQQLKQQNQQLRQEIDRLVQSALNLRSYSESSLPITDSTPAPALAPSPASAVPTPSTSAAEFESVAAQLRGNAAAETPIASTQVADLPQSLTSETKLRGLSGLWLTLTVIAIVIGAFGAGFFMVKPLLQNR